MSRWRWRFSLRFLILTAAILPAAVYWLALPTINAQRFAAAVNSGNYELAESLCLDPENRFPGSWKQSKVFHPGASVQEFEFAYLWRGERPLDINVTYGDGSGLAMAGVEATATRRGIRLGMAVP